MMSGAQQQPKPAHGKSLAKSTGKYHRARIRHFLFTIGPDRVSRGRIIRKHLDKQIEVREVTVTSPLWPRHADGMRIAHVSDFHLGDVLPLNQALAAVELVREQEPDFIACTGDVVDLHNHEAPALLKALAKVNAPLGTALVLGNHDELHDGEELANMACDAGIAVLRNEAMQITRNGAKLTIAGTNWAKSVSQCAANVDQAAGNFAHLLLSHNPRSFHRAIDLGIPLTLSGHTHGGQVAMKNRPKANLAIGYLRSAGLYVSGMSRLYVTTGVGAWFPLRVNCPAEVVMITMKHSDEQPPTRKDQRRVRRTRRRDLKPKT
jgi:predicted MPP superfamily phosphohydrolase